MPEWHFKMNSRLEPVRKVKNSRETVSIQSTGSRKDCHSCSEQEAKITSNIISEKSSGIYSSTLTLFSSEATLKGSASVTSYFLTEMARLESDVEHWMDTCYSAGDRREPTGNAQRLNRETSGGSLMDLWYSLALLPMVDCYRRRSCSLETSVLVMLKSMDLLTKYFEQIMSSVREKVIMVIDQIYKEYFSLGMDILLVLHAFAFLVLSVFQAAVTFE